MTARLRAVPYVEPIGVNMGAVARLWADLVDHGPSLTDLYHVVLSPDDGGTVHAYFLQAEAARTWGAHLGLDFHREHVAGSTYTLTGEGHVTRGDTTALVRIRSTVTDRGLV